MRHIIVLSSEAQAPALRAHLELDDLTVTATSTSVAALQAFRSSPSELVVLATPLPNDEALRFCRQLRGHADGDDVPVLLITQLESEAEIAAILACGVDSFLLRPYRAEDVLRAVRGLLNGRAGDGVSLAGQTFPFRLRKRQARSLLAAALIELLRCHRERVTAPGGAATAVAAPPSRGDLYHRLLTEARDPIFLLDTAGKLLEVNRRGEELLALPAEDIVGHSYQEFLSPAELEQHRAGVQQLLETGSQRLINFHVQRGDGAAISIDCSASVVEIGADEVVVVIAHDAVPRPELTEQFRQSQKMEAIGRLAGGVAHDFNNLLTIINGYGEILLGSLDPADSAHGLVKEIASAGERAAALTRQLLAFSRKQVMEPRLLDLNQLVRNLNKMLVRLIGEHITLRAELETPLSPVKADPGKLEQVLMNLVVNARDAMEEGGELTIRTSNVALDEAFARSHPSVQPGWYVLLAVKDTGCGMTEATRAHLFEPFFTTKAPGKGTGLGLATVFGIVEQSGGHIDVETQLGQGTTFRIYLPAINEAESPANGTSLSSRATPRGTETILLVEDENAVRAMTCDVLGRHGYEVLTAHDGRAAVQVCTARHDPIHLLVTDIVMPHLGGRQLAEHLRTLHPEMKVLYLSGYADDVLAGEAQPGTEVAFLRKPFAPSMLAQKVRDLLG